MKEIMLELASRHPNLLFPASMEKTGLTNNGLDDTVSPKKEEAEEETNRDNYGTGTTQALKVGNKRSRVEKEASSSPMGQKRTLNDARQIRLTVDPINPKWKSAYDTFIAHVSYDEKDGYNCDGIFSKRCYEDWLESRQKVPKHPEESFRRALIGHITGDSRRKPFPPEIEECVLARLREKKVWECFKENESSSARIGAQGFRKMGYHEARNRQTDLNISMSSEESSLMIPLAGYMQDDHSDIFK